MGKLRDLVKNDMVKKTVYDQLVAKVNNIDTSDIMLKTKYNTDKTELEKKTPRVTDFAKKVKLTELENKIPDISCSRKKPPMLVIFLKKQAITQRLLKLKISLIIIIMTSILILQNLIN